MEHLVAHPLPHLGRDPGETPVGHDNTVAIIGIEGERHSRRPLPSRPEAAGFLPPGAYRPAERRPRKTPILERAQQPGAAWLGSSWRSRLARQVETHLEQQLSVHGWLSQARVLVSRRQSPWADACGPVHPRAALQVPCYYELSSW